MSTSVKAPRGLTALHVPVPPLLAHAIGYTGRAHYVAFQWTPYGDEVDYSDGRVSATGNWQAFLAYIHHPAVSPYLRGYDLGTSDSEAKHALILDQAILEMFIAPVKAAEAFLTKQWPPEPPIRTSQKEYLAAISTALKKTPSPRDIDIEAIQRRIDQQYALRQEMQQWLDTQLKN